MNIEQIEEILTLQDSMNQKVHPDWRNQHYDWNRAIWVECAELMDHHGWKWWKKQEPDMDQVRLEIVDIFHFVLSGLLQYGSVDDVKGRFVLEWMQATGAYGTTYKSSSIIRATESLAHSALTNYNLVWDFAFLVKSAAMTFDELYKGYIGKNVLNLFRQDRGYKEGTYQKEWAGREDNEHLVEIISEMEATENFKEELYKRLTRRYEGEDQIEEPDPNDLII